MKNYTIIKTDSIQKELINNNIKKGKLYYYYCLLSKEKLKINKRS